MQVLGTGAFDGAIVGPSATDRLLWLAGDRATARLSLDAEVAPQQATYTDGVVLRTSLGLKEGGGVASGGGSFTGDKVVVAVIDSGIQPSKDLEAGRIVAFYDVTRHRVPRQSRALRRPWPRHARRRPDRRHGQLVARPFEGAASKAKFVGYKVLDRNGVGYTSHVITAIDHAVANRQRLGIKLINLSLGHPIMESAKTDPLVRAVERAVASGIIVVVSAGNRGVQPGHGSPGLRRRHLAGQRALGDHRRRRRHQPDRVARADDFVQAYSSRGPTWFDAYAKPDVVAPGHRLVASASTSIPRCSRTTLAACDRRWREPGRSTSGSAAPACRPRSRPAFWQRGSKPSGPRTTSES